MEIKVIEVSNCWECPFKEWDDCVGYNDCSLYNGDGYITGDKCGWTELPKDKVHDLCPLKKHSYKFKLKNPSD